MNPLFTCQEHTCLYYLRLTTQPNRHPGRTGINYYTNTTHPVKTDTLGWAPSFNSTIQILTQLKQSLWVSSKLQLTNKTSLDSEHCHSWHCMDAPLQNCAHCSLTYFQSQLYWRTLNSCAMLTLNTIMCHLSSNNKIE